MEAGEECVGGRDQVDGGGALGGGAQAAGRDTEPFAFPNIEKTFLKVNFIIWVFKKAKDKQIVNCYWKKYEH